MKDKATAWLRQELTWYARQQLKMDLITGVSLWHRDGKDPLPIRWVLLRDPSGKRSPFTLFYTDPTVPMLQIVAWYTNRWNIEVTFLRSSRPSRSGIAAAMEYACHRSDYSLPGSGLFSLVVLMAHALHSDHLPTRQAAWYPKAEPTFVDALAVVRRHL